MKASIPGRVSIAAAAAAAIPLLGLPAAAAPTTAAPKKAPPPAKAAPPPPGAVIRDPPQPLKIAVSFVGVPAGEVAQRLSRDAGVTVVADPAVANVPVTLENDDPLPLPALLEQVATALPRGTTVKMAYLPALAPGAPAPDPGKIAAFVAAGEALAGPAAPQTVLLQGRRVPADKAAPIIAALDLKPVYLLSGPPMAAGDPVQKLGQTQLDGLRLWLAMTPEQQKAAADRQFDTLMNMDPALRRQILDQQRQAMQNFFQRVQQLPPDQRAAFWRDATGGRWDGAGPPQP